MENNTAVPKKIKNRTTIWSSNYTSGYISEENENPNLKGHMHPNVHCCITAKIWKQPKCTSIDERIKKMWYIYTYTHNGILLIHKKRNLAICNNMAGPQWHCAKSVSQTEKNKYCMITHMWDLQKKQTNKKQGYRYREQISGVRCGRDRNGRNEWRESKGKKEKHFPKVQNCRNLPLCPWASCSAAQRLDFVIGKMKVLAISVS